MTLLSASPEGTPKEKVGAAEAGPSVAEVVVPNVNAGAADTPGAVPFAGAARQTYGAAFEDMPCLIVLPPDHSYPSLAQPSPTSRTPNQVVRT